MVCLVELYLISGPRVTSGSRDIADWSNSGLYSWLIQFPVISSDLPFRYSLELNWIVLKQIVSTSFGVTQV
jgi:hypothetical protein